MKYAAIDIGSNALRLLLVQVLQNGAETFFKKDALFRFPLRLGDDAFVHGRISELKEEKLLRVMTAYSGLIAAYEPVSFRGCATAAMREAGNAPAIVARIRESCGLDIEIIDGKTEAGLIFANHTERQLPRQGGCLYIDVGGGSTQLTFFLQQSCVASRSFDIGTIRLLQGVSRPDVWEAMKHWIRKHRPAGVRMLGIGSGGNINKVFMLAGKRQGKALSRTRLKTLHERLAALSTGERIQQYGLRPDRADVIVPALRIFITVMKWGGIEKLHVPFIGLADGIAHSLHAAAGKGHGARPHR